MTGPFRIALATPPFPQSIEHGMACVEQYVREASERQAAIVCFPESYIPGLRGLDEPVPPHSGAVLQTALERARAMARRWRIAVILPMDWDHPDGILNVAMVIAPDGEVLGCQTKNQLDPTEDSIFVPGSTRQLFEVSGVQFGVTICHEGPSPREHDLFRERELRLRLSRLRHVHHRSEWGVRRIPGLRRSGTVGGRSRPRPSDSTPRASLQRYPGDVMKAIECR